MSAPGVSMRTALVGLDLSRVSDLFVEWLPNLARLRTTTLLLMHVVPVEKLEHVAGGYPVDRLEEELVREARRRLEEYAERLRGSGFAVEVLSPVVGEPAPVLAEKALEHGADYVAVASRGRGWLRSILLGSTAEELANVSRVPVLVAKGFKRLTEKGAELGAAPGWAPGPVVAGIDFSEYSPVVLGYAAYAAAALGRGLLLVHVVEPSVGRGEAEGELARYGEEARRLGVEQVETLLVEAEKPSKALVRVSEERDAALIVVGPGRRRESLLLGTTSEAVLRRAGRHVLVAKRSRG